MASKQTPNMTRQDMFIALYFFLTLSVYQKKWKISLLPLFKSKLLWKLSLDDESLTKLRRESEKTLVEWFWRVLARHHHHKTREIARQISKPVYYWATLIKSLSQMDTLCFFIIRKEFRKSFLKEYLQQATSVAFQQIRIQGFDLKLPF